MEDVGRMDLAWSENIMITPVLRSGGVTRGKWVWRLPPDHGTARALRRNDTDTPIQSISTSTALRAGAILVYLTIYPSEMIPLQFPPCTGFGHD